MQVILQEHLKWNTHTNNVNTKLSRAIGLLAKIRHYSPKFILKTLYYALFNSHLIYACQIWGPKEAVVRKRLQLQNKSTRIINFKPNDYPAHALYHFNKTLKITDYIKLLNCMFVKNVLAKDGISNFRGTCRLANNMDQHCTRHAVENSVILKQSQTYFYGVHSIEYQATSFWNTLQNQVNIDLL